jgi:two-component system LytT family sensor kinase
MPHLPIFGTVSSRFQTAFRVTALLWLFGYAMASVLAVLQGRGRLLLEMLNMLPLAMVAIGLASMLYWVSSRLAPLGRAATFVGLACACLLLGGVLTTIDLTYLFLLNEVAPQARNIYVPFNWDRFVSIIILYCWTFCLNAALFWAVGEGEKAKQAEAAASKAELAALRLQLNPHFLFNTLTAVSSLVRSGDAVTADLVVRRLSEFLRSTLQSHSDAASTLRSELDTIDAYLEIECVRFEGRLNVVFDCDPALDGEPTPSFILQPLLENAMKYAVAPSSEPVQIVVSARQDEGHMLLAVTDDGRGEGARSPGAGIGLANTRARLEALYGREASLSVEPLQPGVPGPDPVAARAALIRRRR